MQESKKRPQLALAICGCIIYAKSDSVLNEVKNAQHITSYIYALTSGGIFTENTAFRAAALAAPVKDGCKFIGWYKDADSNTPLDEGAPVSGQTYYANWTDSVDEIPGKDEGRQMAVDLGSAVYGDMPSATVLFGGADELNEVKSDHDYFDAVINDMNVTITPKPEEPQQEADAALSGVLAAITGAKPFSDVPGGAYYNAAVRWAVKNGIASGTDAKHFSPDAACTRAQAVTFLYRAAGSPAGYTNSGYTDVPETSYCAAPVAWAVALRITSGTGTLTFSPDDLCTRAQIANFLYRANA